MRTRAAGTLGVLVALAALTQLAGCAGPAGRLPQCSGRAEPINQPVPVVSTTDPEPMNRGH